VLAGADDVGRIFGMNYEYVPGHYLDIYLPPPFLYASLVLSTPNVMFKIWNELYLDSQNSFSENLLYAVTYIQNMACVGI
jgi:hypothetical protein